MMVTILVTINYSNQQIIESKKSTKEHIGTLENTTSKQIEALKNTTAQQIEAIKDATQNHINRIEEFDKKSKDALLSALISEYKENLHQMKTILEGEDKYIDMTKNLIPISTFPSEAYQANLNNATIADDILLNEIVRVYTAFNLYTGYLEAAKMMRSDKIAKVNNIKSLITAIKSNFVKTTEVYQKIIDYKKRQKELDFNK